MSIRSSARNSSNGIGCCPFPRLIAIVRRCSLATKYFSPPSRKERSRPFSLRTALRLRRSNSSAKKPWVMSSASSGGIPCRRRNAKMGRQYVRQSFSSASCAAGDSPCASSTTLQCVVVKTAPPCGPLTPVAVVEVTSSGAGLTCTIQVKNRSKSKRACSSGGTLTTYKASTANENLASTCGSSAC